ncbi:MAG: hypothetical protein A3B90_02395 [Candidatus Magasanikbacteria bacterium RIFCSPHIGHO2_02_FULL_41_13]|uniref:Uncharacterized protein n=1 Tax=Candidatus Magasanikbacteria bacterium RIFCSPHIGHO2_02_FULL_41_13 TaxID=1798676 RepID=A0A1F6M407_9BACT|nr:MAG: hypothetical protein A3B90_02395 [Candidatus Magasanikbacteria bacterium RIFCSPHIGHO2_02_FULL_41_13]
MGGENIFRGPEVDPIKDAQEGRKERIKALLQSDQTEEFCMQVLQGILGRDYGVDVNTDPNKIKAKLQNAALELFRDTNANRDLNAEQIEAVASRVMDVLDQISKEVKAEAKNDNPEASQEDMAA